MGFQGFSQRLSPASSLAMAKWAFLWPLRGVGWGVGRVPMGAFGAPWVAGEALGAGLVSILPAGNAMTPSGGFVALGGATPTIMSPTPPSIDSIDLAACSAWQWVGVATRFAPFGGVSG